MKRHLLIGMIAVASMFLSESPSWATSLFTPSEPGAKDFQEIRRKPVEREDPGGWTFGLGAYTSETEFKNIDSKMEQNHLYAHLGYAFSGDFEMYVNVGAADMKFLGAESSYQGFCSIGGALTLYNDGKLSFGPMIVWTGYGNYEQKQGGTVTKVDGLTDWNLGMSFAYTLKEWVKVQAVPFLYFARYDKESDGGTVREKSNVGLDVAARFYPIRRAPISVDVETQYRSGLTYGGSVNFHF